jgi:hypothetical protein
VIINTPSLTLALTGTFSVTANLISVTPPISSIAAVIILLVRSRLSGINITSFADINPPNPNLKCPFSNPVILSRIPIAAGR